MYDGISRRRLNHLHTYQAREPVGLGRGQAVVADAAAARHLCEIGAGRVRLYTHACT